MNSEYESLDEPANPLRLDGIEFVEYATSRPQALGQVLETLGFRPIARHRSREVLLYRQGEMNVVINAQDRLRTRTQRVRETRLLPLSRFASGTPRPPTAARSNAARGRCRPTLK